MFLVLVDELHFGRAAERLHVAQPFLSRTIRRLEKDLSAKLFERTTRRVDLTDAGRVFVDYATRTLSQLDEVRDRIAEVKAGQRGRVRLSATGPSSYGVIARIARSVRAQHPDIEVEIQLARYGAADVFEGLANDAVDLAMVRFRRLPVGLAARPILTEHFVLAISDTHPLAQHSTISMKELRDVPFVMLPESKHSVISLTMDDLAHGAGFRPNVVQTAPDTGSAIALVAAGAGATLTVSTLVGRVPFDGVRVLNIKECPEPGHAYLAWRKNSSNAALAPVLELTEHLYPTIRSPASAET